MSNTAAATRHVHYQTHCTNCDNDTTHESRGDFMTCGYCSVSRLTYVLEQEGNIKEIEAPKKEKQ